MARPSSTLAATTTGTSPWLVWESFRFSGNPGWRQAALEARISSFALVVLTGTLVIRAG